MMMHRNGYILFIILTVVGCGKSPDIDSACKLMWWTEKWGYKEPALYVTVSYDTPDSEPQHAPDDPRKKGRIKFSVHICNCTGLAIFLPSPYEYDVMQIVSYAPNKNTGSVKWKTWCDFFFSPFAPQYILTTPDFIVRRGNIVKPLPYAETSFNFLLPKEAFSDNVFSGYLKLEFDIYVVGEKQPRKMRGVIDLRLFNKTENRVSLTFSRFVPKYAPFEQNKE